MWVQYLELTSALRAVASGLVVLTPEFSEIMLGHRTALDSDELDFPSESLTPREQEVLAMVAEGLLKSVALVGEPHQSARRRCPDKPV